MQVSIESRAAHGKQQTALPIRNAGAPGARLRFLRSFGGSCTEGYSPSVNYVKPPVDLYFRSNPRMEPLEKIVTRNIQAIRERDGLKQPGLIKRGMSAGSINRMKAGQNMTLGVLEKAARALNVQAWELLHPEFGAHNQLLVYSREALEAEVTRRVHATLSPLAAVIGALHEQSGNDSRPLGELESDSEVATQHEAYRATPARSRKA